jgi:hypothetical protein
MDYRKAKKILIRNGFDKIVFTKSRHVKFYNKNGIHICLPYNNQVNKMMWQRLVKENKLIC